MTLTASVNLDPRRFSHEGYCVVRDPLPLPVVDAADRRLGRLLRDLGPDLRPEWLVEPHVWASDWQDWLELCRHPQVLDQVAACLGCDELILMMSHLIVKPANDGLPILWHQDNTYWPSVDGTDVVTVWLALDEVVVENGCMQVIPSSHAGYPRLEKMPTDGRDLLKVQVQVSTAMVESAVAIELARGTYSIHDSFVVHGSLANVSPRRRAGYTMRYGNAATVRVDVPAHQKPVYYLRGDGSHRQPDIIDLRPGMAMPATCGGPERAAPRYR
jgi:phytanoyl-CoA hydroxylase